MQRSAMREFPAPLSRIPLSLHPGYAYAAAFCVKLSVDNRCLAKDDTRPMNALYRRCGALSFRRS
jgi:hypothetical protein